MPYRTIRENRLRRFEKHFVRNEANGCWMWHGRQSHNGYGLSSFEGQHTTAHRAVWLLLRGPIPAGLDVDHVCRNRLCVNPDHLQLLTRSENLRRGFEARGCKNGHPYSLDDVSVVRRSDGSTERRCKTCHRARNARHDRRVAA